jgi:hypothetical protein
MHQPFCRRPLSQGEILNCDLTDRVATDLDPYSTSDFYDSAVTDFYERRDDCRRRGQNDKAPAVATVPVKKAVIKGVVRRRRPLKGGRKCLFIMVMEAHNKLTLLLYPVHHFLPLACDSLGKLPSEALSIHPTLISAAPLILRIEWKYR